MSREARAERRARVLATDTTPGKVLALALLANAPIAAGFVLAPLFSGGDASAGRAFIPFVLWGTPPFAALAVFVYARAAPERRQHRAARIGLVLACTAALLWGVLVLMVA